MRAVSTLLLARAGEGRNYLIAGERVRVVFRLLIFSISDFMVLFFFTELKETGRGSEKTV